METQIIEKVTVKAQQITVRGQELIKETIKTNKEYFNYHSELKNILSSTKLFLLFYAETKNEDTGYSIQQKIIATNKRTSIEISVRTFFDVFTGVEYKPIKQLDDELINISADFFYN